MRKLLLLALLLLLSVLTVQAQRDNPYNEMTFRHDGLNRTAHVYEPDGDINAVMIALHGMYSSARALEAMSGLNDVADERGWVIVYPQAFYPYWDDGRFEEGLPPVIGSTDDVGFLAALAANLRETYSIEDVYLTGHAVGGTMAMTAACQTPQAYTGVAIVGALMWTYQAENCDAVENTHALDMIFIIGNQDHIYHEAGRPVNIVNGVPTWEIMSSQDTFNYWASRNGCTEAISSNERRSSLLIQGGCNNNTSTALLTVLGGGNAWFRTNGNSLNQTGIEAAQVMAAYFSGDDDWTRTTTQEQIPTEIARSYVLYVPTTYDPTTATPVVLSLHGRGANAFSHAISTGFNDLAEDYGFIVVYPQAYDPNFADPNLADAVWNYNRGLSVGDPRDWDDDAFMDMLVDDLALDLHVDMSRLYVSGLSNGGYMANRLACTRGDRYAAFAAVAASAPFGLHELCQDGVHVPFLYYHGTADNISPWDGAISPHPVTGQDAYLLAPIPNSLGFWLDQNDCGQAFEQTDIPSSDPDSRVIFVEYTECPDDAAVQIYAVVGGGHVWPGVRDFDSQLLGEVNMDLNASEAIWAFSSAYTLDGYDESLALELDFGETPPSVVDTDDEEAESGEQTSTPSDTDNETSESEQSESATSGEDPYAAERSIITALQQGGYSLYIALELNEDITCGENNLSAEMRVEIERIAESFSVMEFTVGEVTVADDCRAIEAGQVFVDEPLITSAMSFSGLTSLISANTDVGTLSVYIGDDTVVSSVTANPVRPGQSLLMRPLGTNGYQVLATVPMGGWSALAEDYDDIVATAPEVTTAMSNEEQLLALLQQGGFVIYFRHTATDRTQSDTDLSSCETQRNLNQQGIDDAVAIGEIIIELDIPIGDVYSTGYCRTDDTATLMFGETTVVEDFFDEGRLTELLSTVPAEGTNTVIVAHGQILIQTTGYAIDEGEAVIFRPFGTGYEAVWVMEIPEWAEFLAMMGQ